MNAEFLSVTRRWKIPYMHMIHCSKHSAIVTAVLSLRQHPTRYFVIEECTKKVYLWLSLLVGMTFRSILISAKGANESAIWNSNSLGDFEPTVSFLA